MALFLRFFEKCKDIWFHIFFWWVFLLPAADQELMLPNCSVQTQVDSTSRLHIIPNILGYPPSLPLSYPLLSASTLTLIRRNGFLRMKVRVKEPEPCWTPRPGPAFLCFGNPLSHSLARHSLKKPEAVQPYSKFEALASWEPCSALWLTRTWLLFFAHIRTFNACFPVQSVWGIQTAGGW